MISTPLPSHPGRKLRRAFAAALLVTAALASRGAGAEDAIAVTMDQAKVMKIPDKVSTLVIGNPLIADVAIQAGGVMVITGKGYGTTNVVALDRSGAILMDRTVEVRGPRDGVIVVYRGADRESYNCVPNCEQRVTLGDAPKFFDATLNQTVTRTGSAQGGGGQPPK
jgi:Flp pilus assembly secretin CpaC